MIIKNEIVENRLNHRRSKIDDQFLMIQLDWYYRCLILNRTTSDRLSANPPFDPPPRPKRPPPNSSDQSPNHKPLLPVPSLLPPPLSPTTTSTRHPKHKSLPIPTQNKNHQSQCQKAPKGSTIHIRKILRLEFVQSAKPPLRFLWSHLNIPRSVAVLACSDAPGVILDCSERCSEQRTGFELPLIWG